MEMENTLGHDHMDHAMHNMSSSAHHDHGSMDHGNMEHGSMDHSSMNHSVHGGAGLQHSGHSNGHSMKVSSFIVPQGDFIFSS